MNTSKAELWSYSKGYYKVYLEDRSFANKIASRKDCQQVGRYYNKRGRLIGWDLIFPSRLYNRVARIVGLPTKQKNPNRIRQGKKIAEAHQKHRFLRDTNSESATLVKENLKVDQ